MVDIFLVHCGDTFELLTSGRLIGPDAGSSIASAFAHLPEGSDVVLDLSGLTALDQGAARTIAAHLGGRRAVEAHVAVVCPEPAMQALLLAAGMSATAVRNASREAARRCLATAVGT